MNSSTEYDNYTFKYKILNNYKLDKNLSFLCVKEFTNVNIFHHLKYFCRYKQSLSVEKQNLSLFAFQILQELVDFKIYLKVLFLF